MIWFEVKEETPLDTMDQASLWLWDGWRVVAGGYDEGFGITESDWFDANGISIKDVTHWRAIMPWDHQSPPLPPPALKEGSSKLYVYDLRRRLRPDA